MAAWFGTPLGRHLLDREQVYFDATLADIFGYHALQIGLPETPLLRASRIATRCTVDLEELPRGQGRHDHLGQQRMPEPHVARALEDRDACAG